MTKINITLGRKLNDGNFGNFDLQFSIEEDSKSEESARQAFDRVYALVEEKLIEHCLELDDAVLKVVKDKKYGK